VDSLVTFAIIMGLVVANGVFVAAEFAIVGAPRQAIQRLADRGHRAARLVVNVLSDPIRQDRFIATAQLGITGNMSSPNGSRGAWKTWEPRAGSRRTRSPA
jgi:CBS domain containing-hemolysin-like protein